MRPRPFRTILVVLLLALASTLGSALAPTALARTGTPTLMLHAVDPATDSGIADLEAVVYRWDGAAWTLTGDEAVTDAFGVAPFTVPDGTYWISFEDPWERYGDTEELPESGTAPGVLVVRDGQPQSRFDRPPRIKGYLVAVISGRLVDSQGRPVQGSVVYSDGGPEVLSAVASRSGSGGPLFPGGPSYEPGTFAIAVEPGDNRIAFSPARPGDFTPFELEVVADEDLDLGDIDVDDTPDPAASATKATLKPKRILKGERAEVDVKVTSDALSYPTGRVTVSVGTKTTSAELSEENEGKVRIRLPKVKPGTYDVVVEYAGDGLSAPSTAAAGRLVVDKVREGRSPSRRPSSR